MKKILWLIFMCLLTASPSHAIRIVTGTYTGDGTDNRDIIISPSCQPKAVFVGRAPKSGSGFAFRTDSMIGDASHSMNSAVALQADLVQQINSNGFQVGIGRNTNTANFAYAAICDNGQNDFAVGTYTGDGTDNRSISISPSFTPEFVYVVPATAATSYWRGETSHGGADSSSIFNGSTASTANAIQSVASGSFTVGTLLDTNTTAYHYLAIKGGASVMVTGSFTGDASDNRDITIGFSPQIVFVKGNSASEEAALRLSSHSGDDSFCDTGVGTTDIIQAFGSTTFQVGTDACSNENAVSMQWAAIASNNSFGVIRRRH